jgi:hypothetical protein
MMLASTVSSETVGDGGGGPLLGRATGALLPAFWRFDSEAILMQALSQIGPDTQVD